jgi:protein-disulfide isomerase
MNLINHQIAKRIAVLTLTLAGCLPLIATQTHAQQPARKPAASTPGGGSQTDTELNLLKLEMQRLKSDVEIMKSHIGRIVQYLQQRDAQPGIPQAQGGVPQQPQAAPSPQVAPVAGFDPKSAKVSIAGAPTLGRPDAPVTIVEFSDFECPFCQRYNSTTLPEIMKNYISTGKVRYVFLDFPLEQIHFKARKAAEAAQCAGEQGKFWEMHSLLFAQKGNLDLRQYSEFAKQLGLEAFAFDLCLNSGKQSQKINRSIAAGTGIGLNATPSFIVTKTERGDIVSGGNLIVGAQPYDQFQSLIEKTLAAQ